MKWAAIFAAVVALQAGGALAEPIICGIDQKFECGRDGCQPHFPGRIFNRIDLERGTFARCDDKGCDEYPATFTRSGVFTNIEFAPGTLAKLSDSRNDPMMPGRLQSLHLLEVVTAGIVVLVSYGTCSELDPAN